MVITELTQSIGRLSISCLMFLTATLLMSLLWLMSWLLLAMSRCVQGVSISQSESFLPKLTHMFTRTTILAVRATASFLLTLSTTWESRLALDTSLLDLVVLRHQTKQDLRRSKKCLLLLRRTRTWLLSPLSGFRRGTTLERFSISRFPLRRCLPSLT